MSAALLLQAGGCGISEANRIYGSRYDLDRALAADIVADLNAGDRAGLKGRLSEICKEFQPDIDERIDELFSSFCGPLELAEYDNGIEEKSVSYGTISRILGMSQYYFPIIESELLREGLPVELRALPIIESALSPTAVSPMGTSAGISVNSR